MLLITGITGHTGKYFLQQLIENKYTGKIRCIVREGSDTTMLDKSGLDIDMAIGDLEDEKFLNQCMQGVETIFHIVNIRYTLRVIEAAIANQVPRAICVHTTGIFSRYRNASGEYNEIEGKLKNIVLRKGISVTILRPTMIYGDICDRNMSKFIKMLDRTPIFPIIDNGKGLLQPVNARDLGKAYYDVLMLPPTKTKDAYTLSGDKPISMKEAFLLINQNLGKSTRFVSVPSSLGIALARVAKGMTLGKVDYVERVQRMTEDRCFPHKDAQKDFGYKPESFESGIAREVKEYLSK